MQQKKTDIPNPILAAKTKSLTIDQVLITTVTINHVLGEDAQKVLERIVTMPKRNIFK